MLNVVQLTVEAAIEVPESPPSLDPSRAHEIVVR